LGAEPSANLLTNGGFESGLSGWRPVWGRRQESVKVVLDAGVAHSGKSAARIQHQGTADWSFEPGLRLEVQAGEIVELEAWVRLQGPGSATLCASTWNSQGANVSWSFGERTVHATKEWKRLRTRFAVPPGVTSAHPRLIGYGGATVWVDDFSVARSPGLAAAKNANLPGTLLLSNATLTVEFNTTNATCAVLDQRTGRRWTQWSADADVMVTDAIAGGDRFQLSLMHVPSGLNLKAALELDPRQPEFTLTVSGEGELPAPLRFPHPFTSAPGDRLVVPMNEGISYPVEDKSIETFRLIAYGGHGICMAFWGCTEDATGGAHASIIETPDDAAIKLERIGGRLVVAPEWDSQQGQFGYSRRLRYVFFAKGGHVAIAKRYREHARQAGLLKTLTEKRREIPAVDLLIGAANVWNWDSDPVTLVREMRAEGIERILWSRGGSPEALRVLNEMKVLTSRYDIYQDVMDPSNFPSLTWVHKDWTTEAWPNDIILRPDGQWLHGWGVQGRKGEWYDCAVICDLRAPDYARRRVPAELATHPYRCRFIDTTTAAPWNECYHTNHPMTRTDSRVWKMQLLDLISREFKLVTGCETGHDASVPFLHYFEGMLSLGPYRVPDAGRDMQRIWMDVPDPVAKFQLGHQYRLPLWELVYHDCVVSQWYWGDYNNKLPALWEKRDLFNLLYGTPPMFMFNKKLWAAEKERFAKSYRNICPTAREVGYAEMTDHRFLTADRDVQQTFFANGTVVTVNFGGTDYRLPGGEILKSMGGMVTSSAK
jgi:hypothetical protein